jgi:hypothetical protein
VDGYNIKLNLIFFLIEAILKFVGNLSSELQSVFYVWAVIHTYRNANMLSINMTARKLRINAKYLMRALNSRLR